MPRHDATRKAVEQSLYDIDNDSHSYVKRRSRTQTRYTRLSVKPSDNVVPLTRETGDAPRRKRGTSTSTSRRSTSSKSQPQRTRTSARKTQTHDADVISMRDKLRARADQYSSRARSVAQPLTTARSQSRRTQSQNSSKVVWYPKKRARILAFVLLVPFVAITVRLIDVQIINSGKYSGMGVSQRQITRAITPDRGTISDRNGNILAVSQPAYTVVADPSVIKDPDDVIRRLHNVIVFDDDTVSPRLKNEKSRYAIVTRQVDEATAKRVQKATLPGISVVKDSKREYPATDIAGNVIGFVGSDMKGLGGLEYMLDKNLAGKKGSEVIERDPKGREIPSTRRKVDSAVRGQDVALTIDQSIQYEAQRIVAEEVRATGSKNGTAVIADITTGEILAMVSITGGPDNPVPAAATDRNHAVTDVYEPGSTNKVITIAGALEQNLISPSTTFQVPDFMQVDRFRITDHDPHPIETWTAGDILRESSNIGTIMIGQRLKKVKLDAYMRKFGFGKKTALQFPGEAPGIILKPENYSASSLATISFGNGLAVTPLQMLSVFMTIANDGVHVDPRLIHSTISSDGSHKDTKLSGENRVVSARTAQQVQSMLRAAVTDGTGHLASIPGYSVAGKTGTARKPPYNVKPYKYMASFVGYAPASNPRIAAIVVLDEPQGNIYGGTVAAPVFSRVMQSALRVMAIAPDESLNGQSVKNAPSITVPTTAPVKR